jgi:hypothetical protein
MKIWMIPMKGKGHEVTAKNLALQEDIDIARPLTTDEWDNMLLIEEDEEQEAEAGRGEGD